MLGVNPLDCVTKYDAKNFASYDKYVWYSSSTLGELDITSQFDITNSSPSGTRQAIVFACQLASTGNITLKFNSGDALIGGCLVQMFDGHNEIVKTISNAVGGVTVYDEAISGLTDFNSFFVCKIVVTKL